MGDAALAAPVLGSYPQPLGRSLIFLPVLHIPLCRSSVNFNAFFVSTCVCLRVYKRPLSRSLLDTSKKWGLLLWSPWLPRSDPHRPLTDATYLSVSLYFHDKSTWGCWHRARHTFLCLHLHLQDVSQSYLGLGCI